MCLFPNFLLNQDQNVTLYNFDIPFKAINIRKYFTLVTVNWFGQAINTITSQCIHFITEVPSEWSDPVPACDLAMD